MKKSFLLKSLYCAATVKVNKTVLRASLILNRKLLPESTYGTLWRALQTGKDKDIIDSMDNLLEEGDTSCSRIISEARTTELTRWEHTEEDLSLNLAQAARKFRSSELPGLPATGKLKFYFRNQLLPDSKILESLKLQPKEFVSIYEDAPFFVTVTHDKASFKIYIKDASTTSMWQLQEQIALHTGVDIDDQILYYRNCCVSLSSPGSSLLNFEITSHPGFENEPSVVVRRKDGRDVSLHDAAAAGNLDQCQFLAEGINYDLNTVNERGESALMVARREGHLKVFNYLLEQRTDESDGQSEKILFMSDAVLYEDLEGSWEDTGEGELKMVISASADQKVRLIMIRRRDNRLILDALFCPDMTLIDLEEKGTGFSCMNTAGQGTSGPTRFALKFRDSTFMEGFRGVIATLKTASV